jgi:hypothetical protein
MATYRQFIGWLLRRPKEALKCFDHEVQAGGGVVSRCDAGLRTVSTARIVGSVGRAQSLRADFFYRCGPAMGPRHHRIGAAMRDGVTLPPLELYKVIRQYGDPRAGPSASEYFVVDGHHRVAMARKLGQDFLDAHVVEYRVGPGKSGGKAALPDEQGFASSRVGME